MSRRIRTLIIALGILVILGGGYFGSVIWKKKKAESVSASTPSPKLGNLESSGLVKIENSSLVLEKNNETWELVSLNGKNPPQGIELDQNKLQSITYTLAGVWVERTVDEEPADLSVYGLDGAPLRTVVTDSEGKKATYFVGDMTPSRSSYYVIEEGDPKVYTIAAYSAENLMLDLDKIRQRILFRVFDIQSLIKFRLETPLSLIEIGVKPESAPLHVSSLFSPFILTSPYKLPRSVDGDALDKLLSVFKNIAIEDFIDGDPASLKPYGLDKPIRVSLQIQGASMDLEIGNLTDTKRYAKLAGAPGVFTLDGLDTVINARPFSLINKFALLFNIDHVDRLSVSGGERDLNAEMQGTGDDAVFTLNGKKAESRSFKTFYQAVIGLLADAEYPGPVRGAEDAGANITIEYRLNTPPGARASVSLIPYNRDFYALSQDGTIEFLISRNQIHKIYETADAVVFEE